MKSKQLCINKLWHTKYDTYLCDSLFIKYLIELKGMHLNHDFYVNVGNQNFINFITNSKQINNKRTLAYLYKDVVLVTRLSIFCTTLFTNNNIKV